MEFYLEKNWIVLYSEEDDQLNIWFMNISTYNIIPEFMDIHKHTHTHLYIWKIIIKDIYGLVFVSKDTLIMWFVCGTKLDLKDKYLG